jgi:protein kinase C substrate 80K-H
MSMWHFEHVGVSSSNCSLHIQNGKEARVFASIYTPPLSQHRRCGVRPRPAAGCWSGVYVAPVTARGELPDARLSTADSQCLVAKYYKDAETFTCISNPAIKLPIARLNDDYCDCPDGSDEPGTSACSYLSPLSPPQPLGFQGKDVNSTPALPGFYCKNKGHQPSYIPFTNVNDGACDYELCCDGSDEYERVGGVKCEDKCATIGKEWRKADEARQKSLTSARQKRKELVAEAGRMRKEVEDRIQTLKTQIEGATLKVDGLTKSLAEIERAERGKVVKGAGKGGKVTVLASLAKERIQELTENVNRVRDERNAAQARIEELEGMLKRFKEEYNPNFNDEGVKRAVQAWENYAAQERTGPNTALDRDLDEILKPDSESAIKWEEFETVEESDVELRKYIFAHSPYKFTDHGRSLQIRRIPPRLYP